MTHLVDKDRIVAKIERRIEHNTEWKDACKTFAVLAANQAIEEDKKILSIIDTLEVKEDSLGKFKSLQHITRDLKRTLQDWGYAPNLYFCDEMWHVSWISCEEGDSIKDFEGNTPEEAIDKAYNWFHSTFCNS